jgi:uracil-DNA glycosylase
VIDAPLPGPADFPAWRAQARRLLAAEATPEQIAWRLGEDSPGLFVDLPAATTPTSSLRVPRAFLVQAEVALRHADPARFDLLYRLLWRLTHGEPDLLAIATDADIARLARLHRAVRREAHKMHAFLRFRALETPVGPHYFAWFEPAHHILEAEAGFFVRRFAAMRWSILTPAAAAHWDGAVLSFGPGARRDDAPQGDATEQLWRAYYAAICNPARLKPAAMRAEMPKRFWRNLPEAQEIQPLLATAPARAAEMIARGASPVAPRRQAQRHWRAERLASEG